MRQFAKTFVLSLALVAGGVSGVLAQDRPDEHKDEHPEQHAPRPVEKKTIVQEHVTDKTVVHEDVHRTVAGPARPAPRWNRGQRFGGNRVVFTDYDRYHVRRPPAGYEWVQDGNELVLIGLTDGLISDTFVIVP